MKSDYQKSKAAAMARYHRGFRAMLRALYSFRNPLPALSPAHCADCRLMAAFLETLLDQLYPRDLWSLYYDQNIAKR